jgi:hypothetical protein
MNSDVSSVTSKPSEFTFSMSGFPGMGHLGDGSSTSLSEGLSGTGGPSFPRFPSAEVASSPTSTYSVQSPEASNSHAGFRNPFSGYADEDLARILSRGSLGNPVELLSNDVFIAGNELSLWKIFPVPFASFCLLLTCFPRISTPILSLMSRRRMTSRIDQGQDKSTCLTGLSIATSLFRHRELKVPLLFNRPGVNSLRTMRTMIQGRIILLVFFFLMSRARKRVDLRKRSKGNNGYGRKGNLRCATCRKRHSKVTDPNEEYV